MGMLAYFLVIDNIRDWQAKQMGFATAFLPQQLSITIL
jgi:hypothetical protein